MERNCKSKTNAERVRDWRLRHRGECSRIEIRLNREETAKLDDLCRVEGLDRSSLVRELIRCVRSVSG